MKLNVGETIVEELAVEAAILAPTFGGWMRETDGKLFITTHRLRFHLKRGCLLFLLPPKRIEIMLTDLTKLRYVPPLSASTWSGRKEVDSMLDDLVAGMQGQWPANAIHLETIQGVKLAFRPNTPERILALIQNLMSSKSS
jgi:hypothetical protein